MGCFASVLHSARFRGKLKWENTAHLPRNKKKETESGRTLPPFAQLPLQKICIANSVSGSETRKKMLSKYLNKVFPLHFSSILTEYQKR